MIGLWGTLLSGDRKALRSTLSVPPEGLEPARGRLPGASIPLIQETLGLPNSLEREVRRRWPVTAIKALRVTECRSMSKVTTGAWP